MNDLRSHMPFRLLTGHYSMLSGENQFAMFNTVMSYLINDLFAQKVVTRCSNDHPWITDDFRDIVNQRQQHFHAGNKQAFNYYINKVNRARKQLPKKFYTQNIYHLKTDYTKESWSDFKRITGTNPEIPYQCSLVFHRAQF